MSTKEPALATEGAFAAAAGSVAGRARYRAEPPTIAPNDRRGLGAALTDELVALDDAISRLRVQVAAPLPSSALDGAMIDVACALARARRITRELGAHIEECASEVRAVLTALDGRSRNADQR